MEHKLSDSVSSRTRNIRLIVRFKDTSRDVFEVTKELVEQFPDATIEHAREGEIIHFMPLYRAVDQTVELYFVPDENRQAIH